VDGDEDLGNADQNEDGRSEKEQGAKPWQPFDSQMDPDTFRKYKPTRACGKRHCVIGSVHWPIES
jgi:hypothetical protein